MKPIIANRTIVFVPTKPAARRRSYTESPNEILNKPTALIAIKIAQQKKTISASYLQRCFKIGYNRASRMIEDMEEQGLILHTMIL